MKTIVEPKQYITALWSKPDLVENQFFRLMHYVLRVDHDGKTLLHNVVTGQLIVLDQDESNLLDNLPKPYIPVMNQLINSHYLVSTAYDEHQQVMNIRKVLNQIDNKYKESGIFHYTILPTTACNARCFYCYEQGLKTMTMSKKTARDVIQFIASHCEGKKINIRWFGGEPTIAINRIDQICEGLHHHSIDFVSRMTTNGYLLDKELVVRIKKDWNLQQVMISLDGSETNYNKIKSYINANDNPYQKVLQNIGFLLDQEIQVNIRMNYDCNNYMDFCNLLDDIEEKYKGNRYLQIRPHQINPHYPDADLTAFLKNEQWYNKTVIEMDNILKERGYPIETINLPSLKFRLCSASTNNAIVINPDGSLVKCPDLLGDEQIIGNVIQGIIDKEKVLSWKKVSDFEHCRECLLFPECFIIENCKSGKYCLFKTQKIYDYSNKIIEKYNSYIVKQDISSADSSNSGNFDEC